MSTATLPHNGTETSRAAAVSMRHRKDADERRIVGYIRGSAVGATCDEVEVALKLSHQTASARINGLAHANRLIGAGYTRPTRSGRAAIVWVLGSKERT